MSDQRTNERMNGSEKPIPTWDEVFAKRLDATANADRRAAPRVSPALGAAYREELRRKKAARAKERGRGA